jgi:hypothetical protein
MMVSSCECVVSTAAGAGGRRPLSDRSLRHQRRVSACSTPRQIGQDLESLGDRVVRRQPDKLPVESADPG